MNNVVSEKARLPILEIGLLIVLSVNSQFLAREVILKVNQCMNSCTLIYLLMTGKDSSPVERKNEKEKNCLYFI